MQASSTPSSPLLVSSATAAASMLANQQVLSGSTLTTTTLASLLGDNPSSALTVNNLSESLASMALISEDEELKLLNFPSRREDLSTAIPLTVIFGLLLVTGCIGNICTAIVIARPKNKYMHTATNYYLFSLAMSDLLFLILGLPQEMYTLWQRYPYAMGESFCIIRGYLSEASTYASILTISAFTVERYVAICHPLWAHTMSQLPRAITSIVIIWICAAICAIPPAAELGIITQRGPITNRTLEQSAQCATKRTIYENMFVVSAIVFFIVPMIIVTVLYILIAFELRRSSKMNSAISKQTSSHLYSNQSTTTNNAITATIKPNNLHHHQHNHQHHHNSRQSSSERKRSRPNKAKQVIPHTSSSSSITASGLNASSCAAGNCVGAGGSAKWAKPLSGLQVCATNNTNTNTNSADNNNSLMANIMSQRPSSAIGNEQACCLLLAPGPPHCAAMTNSPSGNCIGGAHSPASSYGPIEPPVTPTPVVTTTGAPGKLRNRLLNFVWLTNLTTDNRSSLAGDSNQAHPDNCLHQIDQQHEPLSRQHSPLSYHESLMQHKTPLGRGQHAAKLKNVVQHQSIDNVNLSKLLLQPVPSNNCAQNESANVGDQSTNQLDCCHQQQQSLLLNHHYRLQNCHHQHNCYRHHHHHHHHHHHQHRHQHAPIGLTAGQLQQHQSRRSTGASSKKSVIRMLVAVVVSFFICWVPFHAQRLLASYLVKDENQNQLLLDIYLKLTYISGVMYYLSSTINPLLYQLMSAKFRLAFKETFKCSLFKCAIFARRTSTGANAPTAAINQHYYSHCPTAHSPAGSVREHPRHAYHQSLCTTPVPPAAALQSQARNSDANCADCQCHCHCRCHCGHCNSLKFVQPLPPASALARLRGRLNSSLGSLLRLHSASSSSCDYRDQQRFRNTKGTCEDSNSFAHLSASEKRKLLLSNNVHRPQHLAAHQTIGGESGVQLASSTPLLTEQGHSSEATKLNNNIPLISESLYKNNNSNNNEGDNERVAATDLSMDSQNFPVHHTMLKFIRSTTPSSIASQQQQQLPARGLARLSSRESDEEDTDQDHDDPHRVERKPARRQLNTNGELDRSTKPTMTADCNDVDDELREPLMGSGCQDSALFEHRMGALIRPTRHDSFTKPDDEEEDADEHDQLIVATSTEYSASPSSSSAAGASSTSAASSSSSPSSSSPDQHIGQLASDRLANRRRESATHTNTATSSINSTSSLSPLTANQQRSKAHFEGLQAEFCRPASGVNRRRKFQLTASKSVQPGNQSYCHRAEIKRLRHELLGEARETSATIQEQNQSRRRRSLQQGSASHGFPASPTPTSQLDRDEDDEHSPTHLTKPMARVQNGNQIGHKVLESISNAIGKSQTTRQYHQQQQQQPQSQRRKSTTMNNNANFLSSSVSSSEIRLDLLSSKRTSLSTTTTSVLDDNSSLLISSHLTNSNVQLARAPKLISHISNNGSNNANNTSNEDDSQDIEPDPSTVINIEPDSILAGDNNERANLIV